MPNTTTPPEVVWRVCGADGLRHAFAAAGGYVPADVVVAVLADAPTGPFHTCEVDVHRTACGTEVPVAACMPHDNGFTCPACVRAWTTNPAS